MSDIAEIAGRSFFFHRIVLMKKLFQRILGRKQNELREVVWWLHGKNKEYRDKFEDDDKVTTYNKLQNLA